MADAVWSSLLEAKNEILEGQEETMAQLQSDLERQRALIEKLRRPSAPPSTSAANKENAVFPPKAFGDLAQPPPTAAAARATESTISVQSALQHMVEAKNKQIAELEIRVMDLEDALKVKEEATAAAERAAMQAVDSAEQRALQTQLSLQEDLGKGQARLDAREQKILELERQIGTLSASEANLIAQARRFEDYIATLPTIDEFESRGEELARERRRADLLEVRVAESEREVELLTESVAERDVAIERHQAELAELGETIDETRKEHAHERGLLETKCADQAAALLKCEAQVAALQKELSESTAACTSLRQRVADVGKLFSDEEERGARANEALASLRADVKALQIRDREQQTTINALEDLKFSMEHKLTAQGATVLDLRKALRALRSANQELLAGNVVTRTMSIPAETEGEVQYALGAAKAAKELSQIQDALADCVMDLHSLIIVVQARSRGEEPAVGELLGLERPSGAKVFVRTNDPSEQLTTIREMQGTVQGLRKQVTDAAASNLGPEACAMQ